MVCVSPLQSKADLSFSVRSSQIICVLAGECLKFLFSFSVTSVLLVKATSAPWTVGLRLLYVYGWTGIFSAVKILNRAVKWVWFLGSSHIKYICGLNSTCLNSKIYNLEVNVQLMLYELT